MSEEEKCREAFESSSAELGFKLDRDLMGEYAYDDTCARWYGFRAAWNIRQQVPDGFELVPKWAVDTVVSKFIKAGGVSKVATRGVELGATAWAVEMSDAVEALAAPKPEDVK